MKKKKRISRIYETITNKEKKIKIFDLFLITLLS